MPVIDNKFTRWDESLHHPSERCDSVVQSGPCPYLKVPGSNFCPMHQGRSLHELKKKEVRNYRLAKWQARINEFADNDQVKSLREEIGIVRMMLEETLNQCQDSTDLLLYSHKISQLVAQIERLVVSCDKLENRMGLLLSKAAVIQLASTYVNIITEHVDDPLIVEAIGTKMLEATQRLECIDEKAGEYVT
jgi:hypothetical protein